MKMIFMGRKKYAEFRNSLPDGADEIDELLEERYQKFRKVGAPVQNNGQ